MKRFALLVFLLICLVCCKKEKLSSEKNISVVEFRAADNPGLEGDIEGTISNDSLIFDFHKSIGVSNLVPTIYFTGKSISPASRTPQNFLNDVTYTVIADDGSSKRYTFRVNRVDSTNLIAKRWLVIRDSVYDTPNYVNSGGGHNIPGVYTGTTADYWDFGSNGIITAHENGSTFTNIHYQLLPNSKISVEGLNMYGYGNVNTLIGNRMVLSWADTLSNGERFYRRVYFAR